MSDTTQVPADLNDEITQIVDATGLICPEPVMMLHSAVRDAKEGQVIKVVATDPSTKKDIANFCEFLNHLLEHHAEEDKKFIFWVRKGKRS